MAHLDSIQSQYRHFQSMGLQLNMERGQPSDANFDLSLELLNAIDSSNYISDSGVDIRNYPGGIAGLIEARELFSEQLGIKPSQTMIGNNSSLEMMSHFLSWALLKGVKDSPSPWIGESAKLIVTVPGYDRHFSLAQALGYQLVTVEMGEHGPDMDAVEKLAAEDPAIKGIYFVPTYSNPTGASLSLENANRLLSMPTAAVDFTVFADDAYAIHHLVEPNSRPPKLLDIAAAHGRGDRVILFGSTSKVTFASSGIALCGMSEANIAYWSKLLAVQSIGPNKAEQWRHVCFFRKHPGGLTGLMQQHAALLKPKFDVVEKTLRESLGNKNLARWTSPTGGYFVSVDTHHPIADRVIELAKEAGVTLTPAGATYPDGIDPKNCNIRLSPTRPSVEEIERAMQVFCCCVELASAEFKHHN